MSKTYLFDWGDTLMVDFPDQEGKMCNWSKVEAVKFARETLQTISCTSPIYIATNAAESNESDIQAAFEKADLAQFITGYFCRANLGLSKGSKEFYLKIAKSLNTQPHNLIMIGDNLENDVFPAIEAGAEAIWFNSKNKSVSQPFEIKQISSLNELRQELID